MKYKAIIFDLFGTLINTGNGSVSATKKILMKHNIHLNPEKIYLEWKSINKKITTSLNKFIPESEIFTMGLKEIYTRYNISGEPSEDINILLKTLTQRSLFPETNKALNKLGKKYFLCIGSNSDIEPFQKNMQQHGIIVDKSFCSEELKTYKPNIDFFNKIVKAINFKKSEVIYVGDSQLDDVLGPKNAGLDVVWINRKNDKIDKNIPQPDFEINNLLLLDTLL